MKVFGNVLIFLLIISVAWLVYSLFKGKSANASTLASGFGSPIVPTGGNWDNKPAQSSTWTDQQIDTLTKVINQNPSSVPLLQKGILSANPNGSLGFNFGKIFK